MVYPSNEGPKRAKVLPHAASLNIHSGYPEGTDTESRIAREDIPDWLTNGMATDILWAIDKLRYAGLRDNIIVYIPLRWVYSLDRYKYRDAKIFGYLLRLNEYVDTAIVAIQVKERKPK